MKNTKNSEQPINRPSSVLSLECASGQYLPPRPFQTSSRGDHSRETPFTDVGEATPSVGHLGAMTAFRNCADDGRPCRLLSLQGLGRLGAQSTTEACRAGTCHTLGVLVNESMDDPVRLVKA